jgi:hypothetical protein
VSYEQKRNRANILDKYKNLPIDQKIPNSFQIYKKRTKKNPGREKKPTRTKILFCV